MTINTQVFQVSVVGDGATRAFSFSPMIIYDNDELEVITTVIATGVETVILRGASSTTYSISIADNAYPDTGTISYPASGGTLIPSTVQISIRRLLKIENLTDLENQGGYNPEVQETQYDKFTAINLQQQEEINRCLKFPVTVFDIDTDLSTKILTPLAANVSQFLRYNAAGNKFELAAVASTTGSASDDTPADSSVSAGAAGSGANYSRSDHVHLVPTTIPRLATENVFTESQVWLKGADATAANPLVLAAGNIFDVTGATTIASITGIGVGTIIILHFDSTPTLTASAADLVLPGGEDIVAFAGYEIMLYEYAASDWRFVCDNADISLFRRQFVDMGAKVLLRTDFLGDTLITSEWNATAGGGTGNAVAMSAGAGGRYSLTTSSVDEAATHANGASGISSAALNWRADQGGLVIEARIQVNDITSVAIFVGFTDVESTTVELPIFKNGTGDTLDDDANDACGVMFDTDGDTDEWFHGGTKNDAVTTAGASQHSGGAPSNDTYTTIRVEVSAAGAVRGYIDGTAIGAAVASAVTATQPLTPVIFVCQRAASARVLLVDYIEVSANR